MIQIGTIDDQGAFRSDRLGCGPHLTMYASFPTALADLIEYARIKATPQTDLNLSMFATRDIDTGTVSTYSLAQLDGVIELHEVLDYVRYETPLHEFIRDEFFRAEFPQEEDVIDVLSLLPALFTTQHITHTVNDGQAHIFKLRPRGATKEQ